MTKSKVPKRIWVRANKYLSDQYYQYNDDLKGHYVEYLRADAVQTRKPLPSAPLPTHVRDWAESAVKVLMDVHQTECADAVRELLRRAGGDE